MAKIDDLLSEISDTRLREKLVSAIGDLRRTKKFGLVFEEHVPETVLLSAASTREGDVVVLRCEPEVRNRYVVESLSNGTAQISDGTEHRSISIDDLLVVKPFGDPVYPVLRPAGGVRRGDDKRNHIVINGENFHALQLLLFGYRGKVDCIYIDPPYNTGAPDWKYNNDYVDTQDRWRHSKWLSMMEKRLRLAEDLLTTDGVLIVTIDEHEVDNLGALLRQTLKRVRDVQMVTIVMNTAGSMSPGKFARAEEYAYFCFFGEAKPAPMETDMLADSKPTTQFWFPLFRSRGLNDRPSRRPNLVYPIAVDAETLTLVGVGRSLKERVEAGEITGNLDEWRPDKGETVDGHQVVWPILDTGELATWQVNDATLFELFEEGFIRIRKPKKSNGARPFTLSYVKSGNRKRVRAGEVVISGREPNGAYILQGGQRTTIPKSTWKVPSHDARLYGTTMLRALLGQSFFNYPKSPYATADTLMSVVADKKDAVVLDFFAGSGTTLQSLAMVNAHDNGRRRCILVTNNEVEDETAKELAARGIYRGDPDFESRGICKAVTVPRVRAALMGVRPDGTAVEGQYLDGTDISEGFEESATFFDLGYEDPDAIEVGHRFEAIIPALWLASGAEGDVEGIVLSNPAWLIPEASPFAVLLDEDKMRPFLAQLKNRQDITHVWLVTDSEAAFARMRDRVSGDRKVGMLYRDYLRNFVVNAEVAR